MQGPTPQNPWERSEAEHRAAALHNVGWERGTGAAVWARAAHDVLTLHESARESFAANTADREAWDRLHSTAFLLVVAAGQVLAYARRVLSLTNDAELEDAIRRSDASCRDVKLLRDLIAHLDDYAVGEGHRQTGKRQPRLEDLYPSAFIYWGNGGGTVLDLAGNQVNVRRVTDAVTRLAQVVEEVRARSLDNAEREANAALRQRYGLPPE